MAISRAEKVAYNDETKELKKGVEEHYHIIKEILSKKKANP